MSHNEPKLNDWSPRGPGVRMFLKELSKICEPGKTLGYQLLRGIRERHKGDLEYHKASRKFVEKSVNFWTVIVQTRRQNLRITVYGKPRELRKWAGEIEVKPDMGSYSAFLLSEAAELPSAIALVLRAAKLRKRF